MTREKQIEIPKDEIGVSGYSKLAWKIWNEVKLPMAQCVVIDKIVREQGYRKQIEGEWIAKNPMIRSPFARNYYCSVCKYEPIETKSYCPECGAKMKGV